MKVFENTAVVRVTEIFYIRTLCKNLNYLLYVINSSPGNRKFSLRPREVWTHYCPVMCLVYVLNVKNVWPLMMVVVVSSCVCIIYIFLKVYQNNVSPTSF